MTVWPLVQRLEREGFRFVLEAGRLRVGPASRLTQEDHQMLQANREELVEALQEDARFLREERAGVLEYEAGFTRAEAERLAGILPTPAKEDSCRN